MTVESFSPLPSGVAGVVQVPGSKSVSNRALVCAALANATSTVRGVASGDDTSRMIAGLQALSARITPTPDAQNGGVDVLVHGGIDRATTHSVQVDAGLAGTTSRFLTAVAAVRAGNTTITGGAGLLRRPMGDLHQMLQTLGVSVHAERAGYLPVTVAGSAEHQLSAVKHELDARGDVSSQFISAIMMIGPLLGGVHIRTHGDVVSHEYLMMTAQVMRAFGAVVNVAADGIIVDGGNYSGCNFSVDSDWSSASYPFAAVAIAGGSVTVPGLRRDTTQPEAAFVEVLTRMGCTVRHEEQAVTVLRAVKQPLVGIDIDMSAMSDLVPTVAAMAVCATTPSRIRGVGFIRAKESDRLGDLAGELATCGADVVVEADGLVITPATLNGGDVQPHDDHRLAMSLALLGLAGPAVRVHDAEVVTKSWPKYWSAMRSAMAR